MCTKEDLGPLGTAASAVDRCLEHDGSAEQCAAAAASSCKKAGCTDIETADAAGIAAAITEARRGQAKKTPASTQEVEKAARAGISDIGGTNDEKEEAASLAVNQLVQDDANVSRNVTRDSKSLG